MFQPDSGTLLATLTPCDRKALITDSGQPWNVPEAPATLRLANNFSLETGQVSRLLLSRQRKR